MRGHGGFVRVSSEPQHGSTFTLHFPIPGENTYEPTFMAHVADETGGHSVGTAQNPS
jgi:hypothetical protein